MKEKTFFEKLLDLLGQTSATLFFIFIFLKIWINEEYQWILNRLWLSCLVIFIACIVLYGLFCYKGDNKSDA
jgi:hypothetical protein